MEGQLLPTFNLCHKSKGGATKKPLAKKKKLLRKHLVFVLTGSQTARAN